MLGSWWVDLKQLDHEQRTALTLGEDANHLIIGPPGSGKTNLLVLRAQQMIRNKVPNVVLLVFNRTLEEFITNNPTRYALPKANVKTLMRWEMELIHHLGGKPFQGKFEDARRKNCELLRQLCDAQKLTTLHDLVLLDEVQDYLPEEIDLIFRVSRHVFAAGDERQLIYSHQSPIPTLKERCEAHSLSYHYRNGKKICELADEVGKTWQDYVSLGDNSQYNEASIPSKVTHLRCKNITEQAEYIIGGLRTQLTAYPDELLGVMCPLRDDLAAVRSVFATSDLEPLVAYQNSEEGYIPFNSQARICICTLHGAKGLEFRAAHLAGCDGLKKFNDRSRRMAYTAITRAKTSMTLYDSGNMPMFLDGAIAALSPKPKISLEDLF